MTSHHDGRCGIVETHLVEALRRPGDRDRLAAKLGMLIQRDVPGVSRTAFPTDGSSGMPVGRMSMSHAAIGGVTAGLLWEIIRHGLAWYFSTISKVEVVYGPLTTAIVVLLSLEIAAALLLLGAQVIAEYERLEKGGADSPPQRMRTEAVAPER